LKRELLASETIPETVRQNFVCPFDAIVVDGKITHVISKYVPGFIIGDTPSMDIDFFDRVLIDMLTALSICHSYGLAHRDVKPHNIIYNPETKVSTLIDFGLCSTCKTTKLRGSPKYISRELFDSQFHAPKDQFEATLDALYRSDVFALGMTMYFLMNKCPPYSEYPQRAPRKGFNFNTYREPRYGSDEPSTFGHTADQMNTLVTKMLNEPGVAYDILKVWCPERARTVREAMKK
jgi:serine/threonine protein kinase